MTERIPCPVDGCDEEFDDEASAIAHMKEKHRDEFSHPEVPPTSERPAENNPSEVVVDLKPIEGFSTNADLSMVPRGCWRSWTRGWTRE